MKILGLLLILIVMLFTVGCSSQDMDAGNPAITEYEEENIDDPVGIVVDEFSDKNPEDTYVEIGEMI